MIRLKAHAKINLFLQVIGKRADGYHEIDSVMQSVSLHDEIKLTEVETGIELTVNNPHLPADENNLAYKAARIFFDRTGIKSGVKIEILKNIPVAAGLAGGSADAAATLIGLNQLFKCGLTESDLLTLAADLGSDVPFCTMGGTCRCRGRGELVEKMEPPAESFWVLVKPDLELSTKWVYDNFDLVWIAEKRLVGTHQSFSGLTLYNDLEKVVLPKYPKVEGIKKRLIQLGCLQAIMSGSGPTVYGLARDDASARQIYSEIKKEYPQSYAAQSVESGVSMV